MIKGYTANTNLTPQEIAIMAEVDNISKREIDGKKAYKEVLAELRLLRINNSVPHSLYQSEVYDHLLDVTDFINFGNWISAYTTLESKSLNAVFSSAMKTGFKIRLANYMVENPLYPEFIGHTVDSSGNILDTNGVVISL